MGHKEDAERFLSQLLGELKASRYDRLIILGDLFDTFAVVRSEILALWSNFLAAAGPHVGKIILLVGNHDLSGESGGVSALEPFRHFPGVLVIDRPVELNGVNYFPFFRNIKDFEAECRKLPAGSLLVCHQSLNGAQFQNGFYDPHGADPTATSHLLGVISGHVHVVQKVSNWWFPGTPYPQSFDDAGVTKGVFEISLAKTGYTVSRHITFDMPHYVVIKGTLPEMADYAAQALATVGDQDIKKLNVKFQGAGSPAEIAQFWAEPAIVELRKKAKRIADALTTIRVNELLPNTRGMSRQEKLKAYVASRKWRTDPEELLRRVRTVLGDRQSSGP